MLKQVYKESIRDIDGDASRAFILEHAKIQGNKKIRIVLEGAVAEDAQDENVLLAITSQKDENGDDVVAFTFEDSTQLLTPTDDISNIVGLEFEHLITYTGSNQSGAANDANDVVELVQRIVNNVGATPIITLREVDRLSSALDLGAGEELEVLKSIEPDAPADPTSTLGINSLISLGWTLKSYNSPVVTCSNLRVTIDINYYVADAEGGTDAQY